MEHLEVTAEYNGVRLDRLLRKEMPKSSLAEIYRFIRTGKVKVNGKKAKQNYRVSTNDQVVIYSKKPTIAVSEKKVPERVRSLVHGEFFKKNFNLLFEDDDLLVCNKPTGLVVHSGTGHTNCNTLIDLAISYLNKNSTAKASEPVLVHRLDRDTSGVILLAKNRPTLRVLHTQMRENQIKKHYIALCHNAPPQRKGTIDLGLIKTSSPNRGMKMRVHSQGQNSLSSYKVRKLFARTSLVEIELHTGKTHQIRVHMAHLNCPIVGDVRYGDPEMDTLLYKEHSLAKRLYLHAESIQFYHPTLKRTIAFAAPLPKELAHKKMP